MKCPKCGFTSFDYLDNCKRCGKELFEIKKNLNILSVVPRTGSRDEFQTKLDAGVPEVQEMIETMDSFIQPTTEALREEPIIDAIDHEIEDQEEMVLEDLPEIEVEDKEDVKSDMGFDLEGITEKPFSMEEGLEEETAEKEEAGIEIELPEVSTGDEISIGLEDGEFVETARSEEDIELSPLEIESPTEALSFPEQQEEDIETIHLDPTNIEVIEFEEEEPSSDEESK